MACGLVQAGRCGERTERRQWWMQRGERVAAVKISSVRRKAAQKFWAPQQGHRPLRKGRGTMRRTVAFTGRRDRVRTHRCSPKEVYGIGLSRDCSLHNPMIQKREKGSPHFCAGSLAYLTASSPWGSPWGCAWCSYTGSCSQRCGRPGTPRRRPGACAGA